jgi:orotidine-5'-phosphate decarboxylase
LLPRSFFLVPGLGAQGGPSASLTHYFNNDGLGAVIASSRAINYPERYGTSKVGGREGFRVETRSFIASVRGAIEQRG